MRRGRPVNPNSARHQRLAELEVKRANGELKRGRPAKKTGKINFEKVNINGVDVIVA